MLGVRVLLAVLLLQAACATGVPLRGLLTGHPHWTVAPQGFESVPPLHESPVPSSGGPSGESPVSAEPWAHGPDSGDRHQEETRERVRRVEETRAEALVLAAQREGREP